MASKHDSEHYSRAVRKIVDELVVAIMALLGVHGVHPVYNALFAPPGQAAKTPGLLRGFVRTSDDLPVRKAQVYLAPEAKPDAEVTLAVNEAGYFEGACPETGVYRLRVVVNGQDTGARTLAIQGCADTLYEILVKRQPAGAMEVALAAR